MYKCTPRILLLTPMYPFSFLFIYFFVLYECENRVQTAINKSFKSKQATTPTGGARSAVLTGDCLLLQIFFKNRTLDEPGYILSVRKNALQILIPKFGLEGTIFLPDGKTKSDVVFTYDEEVGTFPLLCEQWLQRLCGNCCSRVDFGAAWVEMAVRCSSMCHHCFAAVFSTGWNAVVRWHRFPRFRPSDGANQYRRDQHPAPETPAQTRQTRGQSVWLMESIKIHFDLWQVCRVAHGKFCVHFAVRSLLVLCGISLRVFQFYLEICFAISTRSCSC